MIIRYAKYAIYGMLIILVVTVLSCAVPVGFEVQTGKTSHTEYLWTPDNYNPMPSNQTIGETLEIGASHIGFDNWKVQLLGFDGIWWICKGEDNKIYYINGNYIQYYYIIS